MRRLQFLQPAPDAALNAEIESLRSQLKDVTSQASDQYQNGYLAAMAQNPPASILRIRKTPMQSFGPHPQAWRNALGHVINQVNSSE